MAKNNLEDVKHIKVGRIWECVSAHSKGNSKIIGVGKNNRHYDHNEGKWKYWDSVALQHIETGNLTVISKLKLLTEFKFVGKQNV
jgi:hypothetical protein